MSVIDLVNSATQTSVALEGTTFSIETLETIAVENEQVDVVELEQPVIESTPLQVLTRTEIAQEFVDKIFDTYQLPSVNSSFFGAFVQDVVPHGYKVQDIGPHTFLIKADQTTRLSAVLMLLEQVGPVLATQPQVTVPMCVRQNVEGAVGYSLVLTLDEIYELQRSKQEYQIGLSGLNSLETIGLTIKRI